MKKSLQWRFLLIGISILVSFVCFLPSTPIFSYMPSWWKQYMPSQGINLGLDLQGGMHLILKVEAEKAVGTSVSRMVKNIIDELAVDIDREAADGVVGDGGVGPEGVDLGGRVEELGCGHGRRSPMAASMASCFFW